MMSFEQKPFMANDEGLPIAESIEEGSAVARRHVRFGWWSLLVFLTLGLVLETLHALKIGWYLDTSNEVRRLTWTLAHAHGVLLAIVNLAFATTVLRLGGWNGTSRQLASVGLLSSSILLPSGFLLGGIWVVGGDPGLGIVLVPPGGLLLLASVLLIARAVNARA